MKQGSEWGEDKDNGAKGGREVEAEQHSPNEMLRWEEMGR